MAGNHRSGRRPTPTSLLLLRGSKKARRPHEPHAPPGRPAVPAEVEQDPLALAYWQEQATLLERMRLLTKAHGHLLGLLATSLADLERLRAQYRAMGYQPLVRDEHRDAAGNVRRTKVGVNPLPRLIALVTRNVRDLLGEFGLTPSTQAKVHAYDTPTRASRYITPA